MSPALQACPDENDIVAFAEGLVPESRREAIAQHVDRCTTCRALIVEAFEPEPDSVPAAPRAPRRGDALGRYLVIEPIGAGGLGEVFLAYDPELDRRVAVKRLRRNVDGPGADTERERLGREARLMAQLADPNVVHVYDAGVQDGHVFIAMEYVEGQTLQGWLREQARSWPELVAVFVQTARGLIAAHELGIVHRDFKPANVLLGRDGRARVADFGLAHGGIATAGLGEGVASVRGARADITASGTILGTPAYMAPEQHAGARVDARADQFAFCAALFEAVYGCKPFAGDSIEALGRAKQSGRIIAVEPAIAPPAWLHRAIVRGLAPRPEDRFASMVALVEALTSEQRQRTKRSQRRNILALGLVTAGIASFALWRSAPPLGIGVQVQVLQQRAERHADAGVYVFPPLAKPTAETAYTAVRGLEQLDDPSGGAQDAADRLRRRFADELVARADASFDHTDARVLALELYTAALVFDPRQPRALERARVPAWLVADLGQRAESGMLRDEELALAELVRIDGTGPASGQRDAAPPTARLREQVASLPASLRLQLAGPLSRLRDDPSPAPVAAKTPDAASPVVIGADAAPAGAAPAVRDADPARRPRATSAAARPTNDAAAAPATADPAEAQRRADAALALLRAGDIRGAEAGLHRALEADPRNADAWGGLAELLFEASRYHEAERYAKLYVAARPRSGTQRILLGDIQFKLQKYKDARAQYDKAMQLGDARAAKRIEQLDQRLGRE